MLRFLSSHLHRTLFGGHLVHFGVELLFELTHTSNSAPYDLIDNCGDHDHDDNDQDNPHLYLRMPKTSIVLGLPSLTLSLTSAGEATLLTGKAKVKVGVCSVFVVSFRTNAQAKPFLWQVIEAFIAVLETGAALKVIAGAAGETIVVVSSRAGRAG